MNDDGQSRAASLIAGRNEHIIMSYGLVTHVAIRVSDLIDAEEFYTELFNTNVNYRQTLIDGEWHTLADGIDWTEANEAGYEPRMSFIVRDDFFLALSGPDEDWPDQSKKEDYHIGLQMSEAEFEELIQRVEQTNCNILHQGTQRGHSYALIEDIYGYEWDVTVSWSTEHSGTPSGPWIEL